MSLLLYELLLIAGLLCYVPGALARRRLPHRGWSMRLGRYPEAVARSLRGRESFWVHAVSVGEVVAARPILQALARAVPDHPLVLSTITPSGFAMAAQQMADRDGVAVYFPLDLRVSVQRALDAFRPRVLLLMESELWPTVIQLTTARGIPLAVINGRISARAFARYRVVAAWLRPIVSRMDLFLMQTQADADRAIFLGARPERVRVVGSLKWDASIGARPSADLILDTAARAGLHRGEPVIVAGSTHRGEEATMLEAFQSLRTSYPRARLIMAPRHLERLEEVETLIRPSGLVSVRLSRVNPVDHWDVGLVDTMGELPRYYGVASVVFIGGSLIPHGGQNPLEATSLGKPVLFGPFMHNFSEMTEQLLAHQAAKRLADAAELATAFQELLARRSEAEAMGRRAKELTERSQGALQSTMEVLQPLLESNISRSFSEDDTGESRRRVNMARSMGVTVSAILVLIGSVFGGLFSALLIFAVAMAKMDSAAVPAWAKLSAIGVLVGCEICAAWGIAAGIGLLRLRRWARLSVMLFSGALVWFSGTVLITVPFSPMPHLPQSSQLTPEFYRMVQVMMAVVNAIPGVVGAWWLWLFSRPHVKAQFPEPTPCSPRPASITLIAVGLMVGAVVLMVMSLMSLVGSWPTVLFGMLVTGWPAALVNMAMAVLSLVLGIGLWRLNETARKVAIGYFVCSILNLVLWVMLPGAETRIQASLNLVSVAANPPMSPEHLRYSLTLGTVVGILPLLLQLWLLIARRRAFVRDHVAIASPAA